MEKGKKISIQILALVGLLLSVKLALIYYSANYDKYALSSFCSINDFIDCDGAAKSDVAQVFGIPLAYWGMLLYLIFIFLTFVDRLKTIKYLKFLEVFKEPRAYIAFIGSISFILAMTLAGISLFGIHKLCVLCVITYFIDLAIALVASDGMFKNIVKDFKITFFDIIEGVKKYTKTFIVLVVIACSFLAYTGITLNFVPHVKIKHNIMKYRNIKFNPYRVKGNLLGSKNANVVIELYSDYVCPLCYVHNIMLHQAVREYKNIKIIHHNYPFDKLCNPNISMNMHPGACYMAKVAYAAKMQGNYWEMASLLYENQPKKDEDVIKLVEKLNFDKDKFMQDFASKEVQNELYKDIEKGADLEIDATPTMYINGDKIVGVKPYFKLKEILEKHGAIRK